jgi:AcrR family transcriptional regulator
VRALPPGDRRAALIAATIPLIKQHGLNVSTRQIADAAGVAEGTIFGVFRDKASLIDAAVAAALEPTAVILRLRHVPANLDLRARMVRAAQILRDHIAGHGQLLHIVRSSALAGERSTARVDALAARYLILYELATLIEPDAALLRRNPSTVARLLLSMIVVPRDGFGDLGGLDSDEIVSLILDGLLVRDNPTRHPGERPC